MALKFQNLIALIFRAHVTKVPEPFGCLSDFKRTLSGLLCTRDHVWSWGIWEAELITNKPCTWLSLSFLTSNIQVTNNPEAACEDGEDNVLETKVLHRCELFLF